MFKRFLLILIFALPVTVLGQAQVTFTIDNATAGETICYVYIAPSTSNSWGGDQLGATEVIFPGNSRSWQLDAGTYNVRLLDCFQGVMLEQYNLDFSSDYTLTYEGSGGQTPPNDPLGGLFDPESSGDMDDLLGSLLDPENSGDMDALGALLGTLMEQQPGDQGGLFGDSQQDGGLFGDGDMGMGQMLGGDDLSFTCEGFEETIAQFSMFSGMFGALGGDSADFDASFIEIYLLPFAAQACLLERRYDVALRYYERLLQISEERGTTAGSALVISNMGVIYLSRFEYSRALENFLEAQALLESVNEVQPQGLVLTNIGLVFTYQGQYSRALDFYERGREILEAGDDANGLAINYANTGFAYFSIANRDNDLSQVEVALTYTNRALETLENAAGQGGLFGELFPDGGDNSLQPLLEMIFAMAPQNGNGQGQLIFEIINGGNPYLRAALLLNQTSMYTALRRYEDARRSANELLPLVQAFEDDLLYGTVLTQIGTLDMETGDFQTGLDRFNEALDLLTDQGNAAALAFVHSNRGAAYEYLGDRTSAITDYRLATEYVEASLSDIVIDSALANTANSVSYIPPYQRLSFILGQNGDDAEALSFTERGRAVVARTQLLNGVVDTFSSPNLDQTLIDRENELRESIREARETLDAVYNAQIMGSQPPTDPQTAQQILDSVRQDYAQHLDIMQAQGNYYSRELAQDVANLETIQTTLPEDTTLLVYQINQFKGGAEGVIEQGSVVYMVTRDGIDLEILEDTHTRDIAPLVDDYYADQNNLAPLRDLYDLVFAPIADRITTSRLMISADGDLNYVPFAALRPTEDSYLIDAYSISMIPSGTTLTLLANREVGAASDEILALAQPNAPVATGLQPLQNAQSEANAVAALDGGEAVRDATERDLRLNAGSSRVLHISAHAELDPFSPMFSAIYLGADDQYDGVLEVYEIYELDLSATELVILSGCETGAGGDGEDFGLLNRAFMAAGAQSVVSSLWTVDDAATADLLTTFVAERANTDNDADALRAAMLATRDQHPEPRLWASFVLTGMP